MKIDADTVKHIASLASLDLADDEVERMCRDLDQMLEYVATLDAADVTGVEPTTHVLDLHTPMRPDVVRDVLTPDEVTRNAPERSGSAIVVPKVLE